MQCVGLGRHSKVTVEIKAIIECSSHSDSFVRVLQCFQIIIPSLTLLRSHSLTFSIVDHTHFFLHVQNGSAVSTTSAKQKFNWFCAAVR